MTQDVATNADLVQPAIEHAKRAVLQLGRWARQHPDEAILAAAPVAAMIAATSRHKLSLTEVFILTEVSYWCGVLAVREYRRWKTQPAVGSPGPLLRKVT